MPKLKIRLIIAGDHFEYEGDNALAEVQPLIQQWYDGRTVVPPQLHDAVERLKQEQAALKAAVDAQPK